MAFIDEYKFAARAGNGGDGVVRWRREKFRPKGGPYGGDGGRGGNIYVVAVRDIMMLSRISHKDSYKAQNGEAGGSSSCHGSDGEDVIIKLPIGSVVTNTTNNTSFELLSDNERVLLLSGGAGGYGNEHFKSSTNQSPFQATKGADGEAGVFNVELKLIADIGLVGLPNAGKTSLLNSLTNAHAKVGDYPFTTVDPNLGMYQKLVIADIPGLIEGASSGKGLGYKFLRHISRTSVIIHCISLEQELIINAYDAVSTELRQYPGLPDKKEYLVLTKSDLVTPKKIFEAMAELKDKRAVEILGEVSILDEDSVKKLGDTLLKLVKTRN